MPEYLLDPAKGETLQKQYATLLPKLKALDAIRLAAGDHGQLLIDQPMPGRVTLIGPGSVKLAFGPKAKNWTMSWMGFRGLDPTPGNVDDITRLVDVAPGAEAINFNQCSFAAADDVRAWTQADWVNKPHQVALLHRGVNSVIKGCRFFNVRNALSISGVGNTVEDCLIEDFGNDAIQMSGSKLKVLRPTIRRGRHSGAEKLHGDGGQVVLAKDGVCEDLTLDGWNIDMTGALGDYLQGISGFDGFMRRIKVLNCNITCDAYHGCSWYGVDDLEMVNVHVKGSKTTKPFIGVFAAKDGRPSTNVRVDLASCSATGGMKITPAAKGP
jgi:hypothetical protein